MKSTLCNIHTYSIGIIQWMNCIFCQLTCRPVSCWYWLSEIEVLQIVACRQNTGAFARKGMQSKQHPLNKENVIMLFQHNLHKNCSTSKISCGPFSFQDYVLLEWTGMWYNTTKVAAELCTVSWYPTKKYLLFVEIQIWVSPWHVLSTDSW